jgi:group I intron endonuclease
MIIYKITNTVNGKIYIGQTKCSLEKRIGEYKSSSKNEKVYQRILQAIKKYGFEKFIFEILEECAIDKLNEREIFWINFFDCTNITKGYNVSLGGKNVWLVPEIVKKIMDKRKNYHHSIETIEKISNSLLNHSVLEETRRKQSESRMGVEPWNKGTKGIMKINSGTFRKGMIAPNSGRKRIVDEFGKVKYIKYKEEII